MYKLDLRTALLDGANLTLTTLVESDLGARAFQGPRLFRTQFMRGSVAGSSFAGCDATQCNFTGVDVSGCDFSDAVLTQALFGEANAAKARFSRA